MPATFKPFLIGALLATAGLGGCTSTASMKPAGPALAAAEPDEGGPSLDLPATVAMLPEPSGRAPVATAIAEATTKAAPADPIAPSESGPAVALAGPTPLPRPEPAAAAVTAEAARDAGKAEPEAAVAEVPKPDLSKVFPPAPKATTLDVKVASVEPVAYAGPVPLYLVPPPQAPSTPDGPSAPRGEIDRLISKYALLYEVPESLVRRVVKRESTFNPRAYNRGHWGLMQIKHATARGMGYDGPAQGLFDAETNLKYAVKYLRGAWLVADRDADRADRLYQTGYYFDAKRKGLLDETGLGTDRPRRRVPAVGTLDPEGLVLPPKMDVGPLPAFQDPGA